jgi:drug/metabolite transporter (DMT)-like permease
MGGALTLLPFALWEWVQADRPEWSWAASRVAASLYLGPLYGGVTAWLVLGEPMGWHHLGGAALILPGIWLASRK